MTPSLTLSKDYKYKDCIYNLCFKSRLIAVRQCRAVSDWLVWCGTRRRNSIGTAGRIMSPRSRYRAAQKLRLETALLHRLRSHRPTVSAVTTLVDAGKAHNYPIFGRSREGHVLCWTDIGAPQALETNSNDWDGQPFGTDAGPYASPCFTRSPLVKRLRGALTSNCSLQVEEEATTASSTNASAAARTTEATPSSPAQSGTGTTPPPLPMQFCPPSLAPSSQRCHPPSQ